MSYPYSNNSTSREAAQAFDSSRRSQRQRVYDYIRTHDGATDDELVCALGLELNSIHPRRWQLVRDGIITAHPTMRRVTRSGCNAIVWVLSEPVAQASEATSE